MITKIFHDVVTLIFMIAMSFLAFMFITILGFVTLFEYIIMKIQEQWKIK